MRVLFLTNGFPPAIGGTEQCNKELAIHLARRGNELLVVTWTPEGKTNGLHLPFPIKRLDRGAEHDHYSCAEIPSIIKQFQPDVAVISRTTRRLQRLPRVLMDAGVPYLAYCHFLRSKHSSRDRVRKFFARKRFGFDSADLVLAVSGSLANQLGKMGIERERIRVVHPGVDSERFKPNSQLREKMRAELGVSARTMLLTVARVMDGKGQERVLRVLPRLVAINPSVVYFIVGGGERVPYLEKMAQELGVASNVRFVGYIEDPTPYYAAADIFALPSNRRGVWLEAFGLSTLEAAASGLPIVASCEGGAREIVENEKSGLLINESNEEELFVALSRLLQDKELCHRFGRAARENAMNKMTWCKTAERLEQVLREGANISWAKRDSHASSAV